MELRKLEEAKIKKLRKLKRLLRTGAITELQFRTASNFVREYYHSKACKLKEAKTSQLKKLLNAGNINEEQYKIADEFFKKHSDYEKEIDWNRGLKITWEDLEKVINKKRNTKSQTKKKIRRGLEGFEEGKDYLVIGEGEYNGEPWVAYQPFTWEASMMIASHYVEPSRNEKGEVSDAEWCTAYQKDRVYWDKHDEIEAFVYICGESIPTKKVAISISEEDSDASGSWFLYSIPDYLNFNIWDFNDNNRKIGEYELLEVVYYMYDIIDQAYNNWKNKGNLFSSLKLNSKTNRYDYNGSLSGKKLRDFIAKGGDGFTINFGEIKGSFNCSDLKLTSLKGAPQIVDGDFYCSWNQLTSLEGAPIKVGRDFYCSNSQLTSLEGAPHIVGGNFYCDCNQLTSLEGAPREVGEEFFCHYNNLTSLEGSPQTVGKDFNCFGNKLTSLEGAPQIVGRNFDCTRNQLTSLKGAPKIVGKEFNCRKNPNLHSLDGIGEVRGKIYKDF